MERIITTKSGSKYLLERARKWTRLYLIRKNTGTKSLQFSWYNEDIDFTLGDFEAQVKHFETNLK